jgi:hypothetical protein
MPARHRLLPLVLATATAFALVVIEARPPV